MNELPLWEQYWNDRSDDNRNRLVVLYMYLVPRAAGVVMSKGVSPLVVREDLIGHGYFGLMRAVEKCPIGQQSRFEDYAFLAIKNEMIDHLRKVNKEVRRKTKCLCNRNGEMYDVSDYREKSPLDQVTASEMSFEKLVRCLTGTEREIIESLFRDGHRSMDIQKTLGLKHANFTLKRRRALEKIRISLAGS